MNYENRGDGETAGYIDFSDETEYTTSLDYKEQNNEVFVSEQEMFDLFDHYRSTAANYALYSDLCIELDGSTFKVGASFFAVLQQAPTGCEDQINPNSHRPEFSVPNATGLCVGAPENAAD